MSEFSHIVIEKSEKMGIKEVVAFANTDGDVFEKMRALVQELTFKDAKEFDGSIFKQLEDSFSYLTLCNRTTATFKGLERVEQQNYPEAALREALLNALVHRDYGYSGSIIINVNDSCMEFISIGGLLPGLSAEDIRNGISQPRNRRLAEIFHRLKLIEF
ncbi:ATP-binding protein [Laedolimicola sp.]|uniref:ATP-binding protein n=1 Tax=Laedolimicola sp. TaxID=2981663 RepID=UPI003F80C362